MIPAFRRSVCFIAIVLIGLAGRPAAATTDPSPIGTWEATVSGKANGESFVGTAFVDLLADGSVEGYAIVRKSDEMWTISGAWEQSGRRFIGSLTASSPSFSVTMVMSGSASAGRSLSLRGRNDVGDRLSASAKPFSGPQDYSGQYQGLIRTHGLTGLLTLDLAVTGGDSPTLYSISGEMFLPAFGTDPLSGFAVANARGDFVAFVFNESNGFSASVWGRLNTRGPISGSGMDLSDGTSIRIKFFDTPFYSSGS